MKQQESEMKIDKTSSDAEETLLTRQIMILSHVHEKGNTIVKLKTAEKVLPNAIKADTVGSSTKLGTHGMHLNSLKDQTLFVEQCVTAYKNVCKYEN